MIGVNKNPHRIEWWIFKWIFIPIISIILLVAFYSNSKDRNACEFACGQRGYTDFIYVPNNRVGVGRKCVCR